MEEQTMYVFTTARTDSLGIIDVQVFSTEEKAKNALIEWKDATIENGDILLAMRDTFCQILTESGETWTAEITETKLDE